MASPNLLEQLYGPYLRGPMSTDASSSASQYAGRTTLSSGSTSVTVSTAMVGSDSLILMGRQFGTDNTSGMGIRVSSINPGNAFVLSKDNGVAPAQDMTIMWLLMPTSQV